MEQKAIHKILWVLVVWIMTSCTATTGDLLVPETEGGGITLSFSAGISVSRAMDDTKIESALSHLDIFIWKMDGSNGEAGTIAHYERIQGPLASPTGTVTLGKQKSDFAADDAYRVDVIANATATEETFKGFTQWSSLRDAVQEDFRIQVTGGQELGAIGATIQNIPSHFLMDGIATLSGNNATSVVLNDGTNESTQLAVTLSRAAAKVVVKLKPGGNVEFLGTDAAKEEMGYNLRNMPYKTTLLAEQSITNPLLRKTDFFADGGNVFFHWTADVITVTTYVYSHSWESTDFFEKGTRMTVNVPMKYKDKEDEYLDSYYQILLTKERKFERNTYYVVEATIHAPGAIDNAEPVELTDLRYLAKDWTNVDVNIGADVKPAYLSVNKDTLDMHNIAEDATSLSFVSSSSVSVSIEEVYYYDKFGQKKSVATDGISAVPDAGLTGNIKVTSPVPGNNAIRYIRLKVTNNDSSEPEEVLVRQYPLEYITNIQGYYSYRSDFGGTTYESAGTNGYVNADWSNNDWSYGRNDGTSDGQDFGSKVADSNNDGTSDLYYYYWWKRSQNQGGGHPNNGGGSNNYTQSSTVIERAGNLTALNNARMYHVRITSTSNEYKVGIPKQSINNGGHYTDDSDENNQLVSLSFMIASQLGASQAVNNVDAAASHCANYVETYKDGSDVVHLTNWRLPTQAEIQIITKFQESSDAMDVVLSGNEYWSAAGIIDKATGQLNTSKTTANIRCIRDAY